MKALLALPLLVACVPMIAHDPAAEARRIEQLCGDPNYAYESGYNDGLARKRLDTSWTARCMPAYAEQARASYQSGYAGGIEHAPVVVQGHFSGGGYGGGGGGGGGGGYTAGEACRFSSDCGEGRSCRSDASGTNVCMGGGYAGDPCWFSSDCVSGSCDGSAKTCR